MKYSVGFIFEKNLTGVWLIRKNRPAWQAGKLNGIGGKVEPNESFLDCIKRESIEEAGFDGAWNTFAELLYPDAHLHFFWSIYELGMDVPHTIESEGIEFWNVKDQRLYEQCVPNLRWLIPAAINNITDPHRVFLVGDSSLTGAVG